MATIITSSVITGGTNSYATTSAQANGDSTDFISDGVVGAQTNTAGVAPATGSFAVNAQGTPAMLVDISAGTARITATPSGQASQSIRANMAAIYTSYTINSNSSGVTKYDWVYLSVDPTASNNPAADSSDVTTLVTSRSSSNTVDNGSPPTYGILLAVITVANGASSITNANISDKRKRAALTDQATTKAATAGAVNGFTVTDSVAGTTPSVSATGADTNISVNFVPKGTGNVQKNAHNIDWWEEMGRTTLGTSGDTISVTFTAKKYLRLYWSVLKTGGTGANIQIKFNSDGGTNYAYRYSSNGAADTTGTSTATIFVDIAGATLTPEFGGADFINITAQEKIGFGYAVGQSTAGAATAPSRREYTWKWSNTSAQITTIALINQAGTGDFAANSELVVLGHD